jgi:starch phosphorylase
LVLEGYDLALARKLVTGVDIWLNTPQYPLEACGTSGMKAGVNGVINLSVLDGWWAEGYDGENGWAITPHAEAMPAENYVHLEAQELLNILEYEAIPLYYERNRQGYSPAWIKKAKASMKSLIPRYNTERMVMDYVRRFYSPAVRQQALLSAHDSLAAIELSHWKKRIAHGWPEVRLQLIERPRARIKAGESLKFIVTVRLGQLTPEDVVMECIVGSDTEPGRFAIEETHPFVPKGRNAEGEALFELEFTPSRFGLQDYKLRLYPYHPLLTHRFETGLMIWV